MADTDEFMGGGYKTFPFDNIGDTVRGTITELPVKEQQRDMDTNEPSFWDDEKTKPKWMFRLMLQTDLHDDDMDDGVRALYLSWKRLDAVRQAVRDAKQKTIKVGGELALRFLEFGPATKRGFNPPKIGWKAWYRPPVPQAEPAFMDNPMETAPAPANPQPQVETPVSAPDPGRESTLDRLRAQRLAQEEAIRQARESRPRESGMVDEMPGTIVSGPAHHSADEEIPF
jgi:hypothetical protein